MTNTKNCKCNSQKASKRVMPRQDSLTDQLIDVMREANRMGCYDATDAIRNVFFNDNNKKG